MKKYLLISILTLFTSFAGYSQDEEAETPGGRLLERMQQYIQKKLDLSKNESERFSPIFLRYMSELRKTHREFKIDRPVLQLKIAELRVRFRNEFRQVIDEQRANRVFQHQREFEIKVKEEILSRQQNRQGGGRRINRLME